MNKTILKTPVGLDALGGNVALKCVACVLGYTMGRSFDDPELPYFAPRARAD